MQTTHKYSIQSPRPILYLKRIENSTDQDQITDVELIEWLLHTVYDGGYNSNTRKIELKNKEGEILFEIDASGLIGDEMLSNAYVDTDNLVLEFNSGSGKSPIRIPKSQLAITPSLSNYVTKEELDDKFEDAFGVDASGVSNIKLILDDSDTTTGILNLINTKANISDISIAGFSGDYRDLSHTPNLATVATSGSYTDLTNKPTIPDAQIQADWSQSNTSSKDYIKNKPSLFSGDYNDLSNKPTNISSFTNNSKYIQDEGDAYESIIKGYGEEATIIASNAGHDYGAISVNPGGVDIISNWNGGNAGNANGTHNINLKTSKGKAYYNNREILTIIDSSHKLSADLVDDTNSTNKFVTALQKQNWNDKVGLLNSTSVVSHLPVFGDAFGNIQDSGLGIVVADFSVSDLIDNTLSAATISKLTALRGIINSAQYYLFIPCNTQTGYVAATIYKTGSSFEFRFVYDHTEVTVTGDPYNNYAVTVTPFLTQHQSITGKADKVSGATNGNFASLDSNGNLVDSGHKHSDYLTQHQDISNKEDVTTIDAPLDTTDPTEPITTLSCEVGKYYRIDVPVETLAVTLPAMTDLTTVRTVVIYLTAGNAPAVTITAADSKDVYYQDGFEIEAGSTYEINALFNGAAWIVAAVKIVVPTNEGE